MRILAFALAMIFFSLNARAEVRVLASIKPIHSLVAQVMLGVGQPGLIVDGQNSPHTFNLKPGNASQLQEANVIFWLGPDLEAFLEKPLAALAINARIIALMHAQGVTALPLREHWQFATETNEAGHDHGEHDAHVWLDPSNAKAIVSAVAQTLSAADPDNAATYATNAAKAISKITALEREIEANLATAKGKGFIVFHDAYQYFEVRFGVKAIGSISINPESAPGAETIRGLRQQIASNNVACVFSEPQFDMRLVDVVVEGTGIKTSVLDPIGADLEPGPDLYGHMMLNLAKSLADCLNQT